MILDSGLLFFGPPCTSYAESFRRSSVSITSKHNYVYQQAYRPIYLMVNCERLYVYNTDYMN